MTEQEQLMYRILAKLSEGNAPLVFKGALITKLILKEGNYRALERHTKDIDANWSGPPPSMDEMVDTINRALGDLQDQFYATAFRSYGEQMSAGISIIDRTSEKEVVTMDVDMRHFCGDRTYRLDDVGVKGVLVQEILADKITVMSQKLVFRRAKDLVDVYALSHCVDVRTADIFDAMEQKAAVLGAFSELTLRREDVEHAYHKLRGLDNKPPFDTVYRYLTAFLQPFIHNDRTPRVWNSGQMTWDEEVPERKPSVLEKLQRYKDIATTAQDHSPTPTKAKNEQER